MNSTQFDSVAIASIELYRHLESQAQAIPPEITLSLIKPLVSKKIAVERIAINKAILRQDARNCGRQDAETTGNASLLWDTYPTCLIFRLIVSIYVSKMF